jgi:Protein of unknown function (DUF3892)
MSDNLQVLCSRKRGNDSSPHERIQGIGGVHDGQRWYLDERAAIAELEKPFAARPRNFYLNVGSHSEWVVVEIHNGRKYLKTERDGYWPDTLLALPDCP